MTAEELLALPDDQLDRVPLDTVKRILAEERAKLDRLDNPLSPPCMTPNPGFHDPSAKSKSLATLMQQIIVPLSLTE